MYHQSTVMAEFEQSLWYNTYDSIYLNKNRSIANRQRQKIEAQERRRREVVRSMNFYAIY